ncbi:MAG: hypothetical protein AAGI30_04150 [Planctomycetota bacterium]
MIDLGAGPLALTIHEDLGGGIGRFDARRPDGSIVPLMRPAGADPQVFNDLACYTMLPWVNRIDRGVLRFRDVEHRLETNWRDSDDLVHAIHGIICWHPMRIVDRGAHFCALGFTSEDGQTPAWPWAFASEVRYELAADSLSITLMVENRSDEPMPASFGLHPYFTRRLPGGADDIRLTAPVATQVPALSLIPTGEPVESELGGMLSRGAALCDVRCDASFGGWSREALVEWPGSGVSIRMTADEVFEFLHLFTCQPTNAEATEFRDPLPFVAIEPQTSVGNAVNLVEDGAGWTGVRILEPGQRLGGTVRFSVRLR